MHTAFAEYVLILFVIKNLLSENVWKSSVEEFISVEPGGTQSKAGSLHAGLFYDTECFENYGAHLLVVMADVYNIYLRLRLSDVILQKECFSISLSSTIILSDVTHLLVIVLICKIMFFKLHSLSWPHPWDIILVNFFC